MKIVLDPPLPDAFIIFEDVATGRLHCAKTDSEGKASLYLPVGTYNLKVFREGYKPYSTTVTVDKDLALTIALEELKVGAVLEVSGADPKDPKWMPPDGWTYIFSMEKKENVHAFAFYDKLYSGFDTHAIAVRNIEEGEGYIRVLQDGSIDRAITTVYATRLAVAFRIPYVDVESLEGGMTYVIMLGVADGTSHLIVSVSTDGNSIVLFDFVSGNSVSIQYSADWFVFVFDFDTSKAYLYSPTGELLAELSLTATSATNVGYELAIGANYCIVDVDWIAIKSTIPFA